MSAPQPRPLVHHDITPSTRPELASHYLDVPNLKPNRFAYGERFFSEEQAK